MAGSSSHKSTFGTIEKRGHNCYRLKWTDREGTRRSKTVHAPRFVAEEELAKIRLSISPGLSLRTYRSYWEDTVLPSMDGLADVTVEGYVETWEKRLAPHVIDEPIASTDWVRVQEVVDAQTSYSAETKLLALWKKILNMAVRDRIIPSNPIGRGVRRRPRSKRAKEMVYADEIPSWMAHMEGRSYEAVLLMEIGGGLRVEEACALRWEDVSVVEIHGKEYVAVNVDKAVVMVGNRPVEKDVPKNDPSRREVVIGMPFSGRIAEMLNDGRSGPICPSRFDRDRPMSPVSITHAYSKHCADAGVRYVSMQNLRTVYSTNLGEAGANVAVVSKAMGHSGSTTRERNYLVSTRRGLARLADMYEDLILEYNVP